MVVYKGVTFGLPNRFNLCLCSYRKLLFWCKNSSDTNMAYKIAWNDKIETKREKSKTTRFLRFLVRIFLIPLTIDSTKNEISFMFWSKPTMIHIIIYWLPFLAICIYCNYLMKVSGLINHFESNSSIVELYSNWIMYIVQLVILLPFMTCYQLGKRKLKADWFLSFNNCPGHAW